MPRFSPSILSLCLFIFLTTEGRSESIVSDGFRRFDSGGSAAALGAWTRQSKVLNQGNVTQMAVDLKKLESVLGPFADFDILNTQALSPRDTQILAVAHFSYGSIFTRFLVFRDSLGQEYVNGLWFSTDPAEIFPVKFGGAGPTDARRSP